MVAGEQSGCVDALDCKLGSSPLKSCARVADRRKQQSDADVRNLLPGAAVISEPSRSADALVDFVPPLQTGKLACSVTRAFAVRQLVRRRSTVHSARANRNASALAPRRRREADACGAGNSQWVDDLQILLPRRELQHKHLRAVLAVHVAGSGRGLRETHR